MRKRAKNALGKRTTMKSISLMAGLASSISSNKASTPSLGRRSFDGNTSEFDEETENDKMAKQEAFQRRVDRFWGLDKDLHDRNNEISLMTVEDRLSCRIENYHQRNFQHKLWDMEWEEEENWRKSRERERRAQFRSDHLRLLNSPLSVEDLLKNIWQSGSADTSPLLPQIASLNISEAMKPQTTTSSISGGPSIESMSMSLHLEGLQRTREILEQARGQFKNIMKGFGAIGGPLNASVSTVETKKSAQTKSALSIIQDAAKKMKIEELMIAQQNGNKTLERNDVLEGHPRFGWDQESILHAAFLLLDSGPKGYLSRDDMSGLSHRQDVHALLKYTVFWSLMKKREWGFFEALLYPEQINAPISRGGPETSASSLSPTDTSSQVSPRGSLPSLSRQTKRGLPPPPPESCSYSRWFQAAISLAREQKVNVRHIRTTSEHAHLSEFRTHFPSEYWSNEHVGPVRDNRVSRQLRAGDCVWVMHRRGVRWLPAVVEKVYPPSAGSSSGSRGKQSMYDVWYPLNESELQRAKLATTSRQLLALPSSDFASEQGLPRKPLAQERAVCAYAFDLIDTSAVGVVEVPTLIEKMQTPEMCNIVDTSFVLASIFREPPSENQPRGGAKETNELSRRRRKKRFNDSAEFYKQLSKEKRPPLRTVFMDTFAVGEEEDDDAMDGTDSPDEWGSWAESLPLREGEGAGEDGQSVKMTGNFDEDSYPDDFTHESRSGPDINLGSAAAGALLLHAMSSGAEGEDEDEGMIPDPPPGTAVGDRRARTTAGDGRGSGNKPGRERRQKRTGPPPPPCISKIDFLEFCDAALNIYRYDLHSIYLHS